MSGSLPWKQQAAAALAGVLEVWQARALREDLRTARASAASGPPASPAAGPAACGAPG